VRYRKTVEGIIEKIFFVCGLVSILSVLFITIFIFLRGLPLFQKVPLVSFLFSTNWSPTDTVKPTYGILSFIIGSFYITFGSLLLAVPIGVACGIFLSQIATRTVAKVMRSVVELLAGIPSVIYGFFGVMVLAKLIREIFGGNGYSVLTASIILAIMTLPTIVNITEVSLRAVPQELKEGSLALGATRWQTISKVLVPAARSGIMAGVVLGMGRAIGETMAVLMVAGNAPIMPKGPLSMARTLTMNIVTDMGYAAGDHMTSLFATGIVLFVFILGLNLAVHAIMKRSIKESV
jgi:phosphate transport system permease protein